jgi:hypothetical protein
MKTLSATSSRPDPETLAAHEVLAHPCTVFYPCICGLHEGAVAVTAALIDYDNMGLLPQRPRRGDDRDRLLPLHRRATTLSRCSARLVVTIHDLLLASFPG